MVVERGGKKAVKREEEEVPSGSLPTKGKKNSNMKKGEC